MKDFGARTNLVVVLLSLATMVGCSALNASQPTAQATNDAESNSRQGALNPRSISFGNVAVGKTQIKTTTLSNPGTATMTITHAAISGQGFALNGPNLPLVLSPKQTATVKVSFTPMAGGAKNGTISLIGTTKITVGRTFRRGNRPTHESPTDVVSTTVSTVINIPVSGVGMGGGGTSGGTGGTSGGSSGGTSGGTTAGQLSASPAAVALGKVKIGASMTQSVALVNSGKSNVTVKQATVTGRGFKISGISFPVTLPPGQRKPFLVTFTPVSTGSATGVVAVTSDDPNSVVDVPVSAMAVTSVTPGALSTSDSSLDFSNVPVGSTNPASETLTNTGGSTVNITQANVTGTGFKVTGLSLPLSLSAGQSFTFGVVFAPTSGGSAAGSISVISDASNPNVNISMVGTATVAGKLAVSPAALSFGSVSVGQNKTMTASLTATGSSITITAAGMTSSEFAVSGLSLPITLAAGKSVSFTVKFAPQSSGVAAAGATFSSNASNSAVQQSLTGTGAAGAQHSVSLSWSPSSTQSVVGYNMYRGVTSGGPYTQITSMNPDTTFTDAQVQAGQTYFYVTTAVDSDGKESANSNQTQAVIPAQ